MALDKLVDSTQLTSDLTSVANAIRTKGGTSGQLAFPSEFVSAIEGIQTGGASEDVIFIDYDGSVCDTKTKAEINAMTSDSDLPANPSHTGLTAQGWNWTVAQLKAQLTAMPNQKIIVGQMYVTTSGDTEIDIDITNRGLVFSYKVNGTIVVDWGDNTSDTFTDTSMNTTHGYSHTYSSTGSYTIKVHLVNGEWAFASETYASFLSSTFGMSESSARFLAACINAVRIGTGMTYLYSGVFRYCVSLEYVTIPNTVTAMNNEVFANCYRLPSLTYPSGFTAIGKNATPNCYSLVSVSIPYGVTVIGESVFFNCKKLKNLTLPSGLTEFGSNVFSGCVSVDSFNIPSLITSLPNSAFSTCSSIKSFTIPSSITSIGSSVFMDCPSLESIVVPSSVTSIGNSAFSGCNALKSVQLPSTLTSIGNTSFTECHCIRNFTIPSGVTSIGSTAFYNCDALESITIPSGVTSIGSSAFAGCYSLTSVTIPADVTTIGTRAFRDCCGVLNFHLLPTTPPTLTNANTFENINPNCYIYVPYSSDHSILNAYKAADYWSTYASQMREEVAPAP